MKIVENFTAGKDETTSIKWRFKQEKPLLVAEGLREQERRGTTKETTT